MEKKETNKAITRLTQKLRVLAGYNPDLFRNSTLYFHGFKGAIPPGFELKDTHSFYKTYQFKDGGDSFVITIFT